MALALLEQYGPLAVTSANLAGNESVLNHLDARDLFGDAVAVYLEGKAHGGQASKIIDLTEPSPLVLRDGPVRNL